MSAALQPTAAPGPGAATTRDATRLAAVEAEVERGFEMVAHGYEIAGRGLNEIRVSGLDKVTHATWDGYLRERWNVSRSYALRKMRAAAVVGMLPIGNRPQNEAQARALLEVVDPRDAVAIRAVWEEAERLASERGGMTAKVITEAGKLRRREVAIGERGFFRQFSRPGRGSTWRDPEQPPPLNLRPPLDLRHAKDVSERHREWVNREFRIPKGLPPHPESNTVRGWRAQLAKEAEKKGERVKCPTCGHRVKPEDIPEAAG